MLTILLAAWLSIPTLEYRQIGPYRTDTSVNDNGERITFFEVTIRDQDGREWVGYGMERDEAAANAKRHYRDWTR